MQLIPSNTSSLGTAFNQRFPLGPTTNDSTASRLRRHTMERLSRLWMDHMSGKYADASNSPTQPVMSVDKLRSSDPVNHMYARCHPPMSSEIPRCDYSGLQQAQGNAHEKTLAGAAFGETACPTHGYTPTQCGEWRIQSRSGLMFWCRLLDVRLQSRLTAV